MNGAGQDLPGYDILQSLARLLHAWCARKHTRISCGAIGELASVSESYNGCLTTHFGPLYPLSAFYATSRSSLPQRTQP
jgi:hypothetical protein